MSDKLLSSVKSYLRFSDSDSVDDELQTYINAAVEYLRNSGIDEVKSELYNQAVAIIVAQWYENRLDDDGGLGSPVIGLRSIITQLSYIKRSSDETR